MLSIDDFISLIWGLPKMISSIIDQECQKLPIFFKHAMKFLYIYVLYSILTDKSHMLKIFLPIYIYIIYIIYKAQYKL